MSSFASWEVARRANGVRIFFTIAFLFLAAAFFRAQVVDHERFSTQAANTHLKHIPLEPPRGDILDRNGLLIAQNYPGYSIKLLATSEDSLRAELVRLDALIPDDTVDAETVVHRWKDAQYQPALVYASGSYNVVAALEEHRAILPGLVIQAEPRRRYPDSDAVGHLVGYVGEISSAEIDNGTFPGALSGEIVGKQGLEIEYDSLLRGRPGVRFVEVTAKGQVIRDQAENGSIAPVAGQVVRTTLDLDLQRFIDSMWRADPGLSSKRGAMVAMTPSGEVLAYASFPTFNPNKFIGRIDPVTWHTLMTDPNRPLYNRVIQATYPPASPFKLAMAAIALRHGYTMESMMPVGCNGGFQFGNRVYHCWKPAGHGRLTLRQAIATSCDVFFYQLGLQLGADTIMAGAHELGFGSRSGIDLSPESKGILNASVKDYVTSRGVSYWGNGETLNLSIGQGHHTETLISMVSFYAALAGDGIKRSPHIIEGRPSKVTQDLHLTPAMLADLRQAMIDVVNSGTATGDLARETGLKEFQIAGKTGSAQVTGQKDMAWFISFAPADAPKIIVGIEVEEGIHGALVAKFPVRAIVHYLTGKSLKVDVGTLTEDTTRSAPTDTDSVVVAPPALPTAAPKKP